MIGAVESHAFAERSASRIAIGIDPAEHSGIATFGLGALKPEAADLVRIKAAGFTQVAAIAVLQRLIGEREWIAVLEHSTSPRKGFGAPPAYAYSFWDEALRLCARERCAAAGVRYREPTILTPYPNDWRLDVGLKTRGAGKDWRERRADLKRAALAYVRMVHGIALDSDDVAEALVLAQWGSLVAKNPVVALRGRKPVNVRWAR